jgi:hypothetical protein
MALNARTSAGRDGHDSGGTGSNAGRIAAMLSGIAAFLKSGTWRCRPAKPDDNLLGLAGTCF